MCECPLGERVEQVKLSQGLQTLTQIGDHEFDQTLRLGPARDCGPNRANVAAEKCSGAEDEGRGYWLSRGLVIRVLFRQIRAGDNSLAQA